MKTILLIINNARIKLKNKFSLYWLYFKIFIKELVLHNIKHYVDYFRVNNLYSAYFIFIVDYKL